MTETWAKAIFGFIVVATAVAFILDLADVFGLRGRG